MKIKKMTSLLCFLLFLSLILVMWKFSITDVIVIDIIIAVILLAFSKKYKTGAEFERSYDEFLNKNMNKVQIIRHSIFLFGFCCSFGIFLLLFLMALDLVTKLIFGLILILIVISSIKSIIVIKENLKKEN